MTKIDFDKLTEIDEFKAILNLYEEAKTFLENFDWCKKTISCWYDSGIYEKIGVFLFKIEPINKDVDEFIWIIIGDLPTVYLDQSVINGQEALKIYCELMKEWADNIIQGKSINECYPIPVDPTKENAELLIKRIEFIKKELLILN